MILNHQRRVRLNLPRMRAYVRRLRATLRLGRRDFNVCFVDDKEIERLNARYRGKPRATDVLSFPWDLKPRAGGNGAGRGELSNFLGDVVISAATARRNARLARHSTEDEIRWLVLHGVLHLLGFDHEKDQGEMTVLENSMRAKLGV